MPQRVAFPRVVPMGGLLLPFLLCLLLLSTLPTQARRDPETGRIRVLYLGDALGASPVPYMIDEPFLSVTPVLACKMWYPYETIRKSLRVYLPRTFDALNRSYDIVILSDANVISFEKRHLHWFRSFVEDGGGGLAMVGGFESFGAHGFQSWGPTPVAAVLPVDCLPLYGAEGRIIIRDPQCPVVYDLPWDTLGDSNYFEGNRVAQRDGSRLVASFSDGNPMLVWWDFGRGRSYAMASDWTPGGGARFMRWDHYGDYCINVALFTAGEPVPKSVEEVHKVRAILRAFSEDKSFLYSVIDFAEKFGANTRNIEEEIREAEDAHRDAQELYMSYEFIDAASRANQAVRIVEDALDEAIEAKDRALLWVFMIEWLVVISTCMISGIFVYELMVVRRLFKPVTSSIFTKGDQGQAR